METLTLQELQSDFDRIIHRVENGETFVVESENGNVMLVPYTPSSEEVDDLVRIYTEHEEGS